MAPDRFAKSLLIEPGKNVARPQLACALDACRLTGAVRVSAITLHRTDPARNMCRFYRMDVQPDLFGQWCFIREWGRIGAAGQTRNVP